MPTRKTREQLDAEMGPPDPSDPSDASDRSESDLSDASDRSESDLSDASDRSESDPSDLSDRSDEPPGENLLAEDGSGVRPEVVDAPPPVEALPALEDPAAAEGADVDPRLRQRLLGVAESLLFVAGEPLSLVTLLGLLREVQPDLSARALRGLLEALRDELREGGRGVRLAEVAGGFQLRTPSEFSPQVRRLITRRPPRMTRPTLETLAIVAYRQPVTRSEIEDIRGVDSGPVLKHLLEKKLVKILGRKEDVGRPLIYGTTKEFLEFFSLRDLKSLPTLKDFVELSEEHRAELGLAPTEVEAPAPAPFQPGELLPEVTDAYSPVGEDEVLQELTEALDQLKVQHRTMKREVFGQREPKPGEEPPEEAPPEEVFDGRVTSQEQDEKAGEGPFPAREEPVAREVESGEVEDGGEDGGEDGQDDDEDEDDDDDDELNAEELEELEGGEDEGLDEDDGEDENPER